MRIQTLFCTFFFVSSCFTGCLTSDEKGRGFVWPEKVHNSCSLETNFDVGLGATIICETYLDGFTTPIVSLKYPHKNELLIADLHGELISWDGKEKRTVGNISHLISTCHFEQGLLGMTFLDNQTYDKLLISYIEKGTCEGQAASALILSEISIKDDNLDYDTLKILKKIEQPYRNHNAGHIIYVGNNQYLWGVGDGGSSNDPNDNGQNTSTELGAIHLLNYNNDTLDSQLLHHGLRNPWRFDIDPEGGLWIADVGQNCFEEVNYIQNWTESSNFGWSLREGSHTFSPICSSQKDNVPDGFTDPVLEYSHSNGNCSITGGFWLDWGPSALQSGYIYGDFCSGTIWLAKLEQDNGIWTEQIVANTNLQITGFGRGLNDEILLFNWSGTIEKIDVEVL